MPLQGRGLWRVGPHDARGVVHRLQRLLAAEIRGRDAGLELGSHAAGLGMGAEGPLAGLLCGGQRKEDLSEALRGHRSLEHV